MTMITCRHYTRLRPKSTAGFTLVELLVVIALVAVLVGGIGLALGRGDNGVALQTAQSTLNSAIAGVRAKAALEQKSAALFVNAEPNTDGFLREFRIAVDVGGAGTPWEVKGDPIFLPNGVYLVPTAVAFASPGEVDFQGTWNTGSWNLRSTAYSIVDTNIKDAAGVLLKDESGNTMVFHRIASISAAGTMAAGKIVFSPAERQADLSLQFNKPDFIRGSVISRYGVATLVNDAEAIK